MRIRGPGYALELVEPWSVPEIRGKLGTYVGLRVEMLVPGCAVIGGCIPGEPVCRNGERVTKGPPVCVCVVTPKFVSLGETLT